LIPGSKCLSTEDEENFMGLSWSVWLVEACPVLEDAWDDDAVDVDEGLIVAGINKAPYRYFLRYCMAIHGYK
jgi:hypothetical protein